MALAKLFNSLGISQQVVVHVGAYHGEELEGYLQLGFSQIVLVEPNPAALKILRPMCAHQPRVSLVEAAMAARAGRGWFYLAQHPPQSSLLPPNPDWIAGCGGLEVDCRTLDETLEQLAIEPATVSLLVVDAQGAEQQVLEGAARLLQHLRLLIVEVNDVPRYQGCPTFRELNAYLERLHFSLLYRNGPFPDCPGGNAIYVRENRSDVF